MPSRYAVICWACHSAFSLVLALAALSRPASRRLRWLGAWTCIAAIASSSGRVAAGPLPSVVSLMRAMIPQPVPDHSVKVRNVGAGAA